MRYVLYVGGYLLAILITMGIYSFFCSKGRIGKAMGTFLLTIGTVIVSGIRCNFGSDYYSYFLQYNYRYDTVVQAGGVANYLANNIQIGFPLLMQITRNISNSPYAIFWSTAIIIYPIIFTWIHIKSKNAAFSAMVFFLLGFFDITNNTLKQSIALVCLIIAYEMLLKRKKVLSILFSIMAILFHVSSILPIGLMIFSYYIRFDKKIYKSFLFISGIVGINFIPIALFIIKHIPILTKYEKYVMTRTFSIPFFVFTLTILIGVIWFIEKTLKNKTLLGNEMEARLSLLILSLPILFASFHHFVLLRIAYFSLLQLVLLIPNTAGIKKERKKNVLVIEKYTIFLFVLFIIVSLASGNNRFFTYETYLTSTPRAHWYR